MHILLRDPSLRLAFHNGTNWHACFQAWLPLSWSVVGKHALLATPGWLPIEVSFSQCLGVLLASIHCWPHLAGCWWPSTLPCIQNPQSQRERVQNRMSLNLKGVYTINYVNVGIPTCLSLLSLCHSCKFVKHEKLDVLLPPLKLTWSPDTIIPQV